MSPVQIAPSIDTIPLEVLERIALFVGSEELSGPPKDLVSLCLACKVVHDSLSFSCNPSLYASLFRHKFDIAAPLRRLGPQRTTVQCLASELRTRFEVMQRIRRGIGNHGPLSENREHDLWTTVFMMLENDGRNVIQLTTFGKVHEWLSTYFLLETGGSCIKRDILTSNWPSNKTDNLLALWLLYLLDAEESSSPCNLYEEILRIYAIGANRYPLTYQVHHWSHYSLHQHITLTSAHHHFNRQLFPVPPPAALSAVSGYMARLKQPTAMMWAFPQHVLYVPPEPSQCAEGSTGGRSSNASSSQRWDCVWERCIGPGIGRSYVDPENGLPRYYRPGSLDGSWEGLFTYAEFGVYAAMLSGEPPQIITETTIGHNLQVWKVREYNLYSSTASTGVSDDPTLPAGSVLSAFFPLPTTIQEDRYHAVFTHSSQKIIYHRPRQATDGANQPGQGILRDVIIIGEGHSAWGDFKLRGRIRPSDAFVTILKEYDGPEDRGRWLYRGYIFGGKFVGRWRDVLTPVHMSGYEGGFELTKRVSL